MQPPPELRVPPGSGEAPSGTAPSPPRAGPPGCGCARRRASPPRGRGHLLLPPRPPVVPQRPQPSPWPSRGAEVPRGATAFAAQTPRGCGHGGRGDPERNGDPRQNRPAEPGTAGLLGSRRRAMLLCPPRSSPPALPLCGVSTGTPRCCPSRHRRAMHTPRCGCPGWLRCYFWQPPKSSSRAINNESAKFVWPLLYKER